MALWKYARSLEFSTIYLNRIMAKVHVDIDVLRKLEGKVVAITGENKDQHRFGKFFCKKSDAGHVGGANGIGKTVAGLFYGKYDS